MKSSLINILCFLFCDNTLRAMNVMCKKWNTIRGCYELNWKICLKVKIPFESTKTLTKICQSRCFCCGPNFSMYISIWGNIVRNKTKYGVNMGSCKAVLIMWIQIAKISQRMYGFLWRFSWEYGCDTLQVSSFSFFDTMLIFSLYAGLSY